MEAVFQHGQASSMKMGYMYCFFISIFIFNFINFYPVAGCMVFEKTYGEVTDDKEIKVGNPLSYQCTLNRETVEEYNVTSKDLIVKVGKRILPVLQVDNYTVYYRVEKATANDSGFYQCVVPIPGYETPQLVCASTQSVGSKPGKVSNFSCISISLRSLTCSWTPPPNDVKTEYRLEDYLFGNKRYTRPCAIPRRTSCLYTLGSRPPYRRDAVILNFILTGSNTLGTSQEFFSIKHYEIVKPNIPSKVSFKSVSKTSLVLEILAPKGLEYGEFRDGLVYEAKFYPVSTIRGNAKVVTVQNETNAHIEIKNLVPHTQYIFEVRCRLNVTGDHYYWSDTVKVTEITLTDVPYLAPEIDSSSFDMQVIDNNATITLYWKAVPSEFENGPGFHYIIKYHEHYVPTRFARHIEQDNDAYILLENSTMHTFRNMEKDTAYIFSIVAANEIGKSSNESAVIIVDKAKKLLPGPKDITAVSYGLGHYEVSYQSPDPKITNFTLYICETLKSRPATCEGPISWIANTNKTHHKLNLPDQTTNYQFAVASKSNGVTSGMYWAPCVVTYGVLYKMNNVQAIPKNSTSLKVTWSYACPAISKVVLDAEVVLCPFQGSCNEHNFENCSIKDGGSGLPTYRVTDPSKTELILGGLRPYTKYYIIMRGHTAAGWGPYSNFTCESTMSSAPSDSPSDVNVQLQPIPNSQITSLKVFFDPPHTPNGVITRYIVYYNKTSPLPISYHKEVRVQQSTRTSTVLDNIYYHTNYSIEVSACVRRACSRRSEPVYQYTGVTNPGTTGLPRVELRETFVNVSWDPPLLSNGLLDFYQIRVESNDTNLDITYNVTDQNYLIMERDCREKKDESIYSFQIRGVNLKDGMPLYGDYSSSAKTILCPSGGWTLFQIGMMSGGAIFVVLSSLFTYRCLGWLKQNIVEAKRTEVKLPKGLESLENPLSSYDKFKSGLQNNHDAGIPYDKAYERFYTVTAGDIKDAEEHSKRGASDRNLSGESNFSGKCHDSISSANTTKTHNSIDSGAEIESPPSPDSFCSDSGSANTTPRAFKPGLDIVNEVNQLASKDSGLEKDGPAHAQNANFGAKGMWCIKRPNGASNFQSFIPHGEHNRQRLLSNSEPSVADFDVGDGTEPLVNPVMQPYSKFGLARSASNGINVCRDTSQKQYTKFGIVYRPLKNSLKLGPLDQQVFPATAQCIPAGFPARCGSLFKKEGSSRIPVSDAASTAYSKFGVMETDSSKTLCDNSHSVVHNSVGNPSSYVRFSPVAGKKKDLGHKPSVKESDNQLENGPSQEIQSDDPPLVNGEGSSHRTDYKDTEGFDNVLDFLGSDFKNDFVSVNMLGGCGYKIGDVEGNPSNGQNVKPLIQVCLDPDELIRCIDGCLPLPELNFNTPKSEDEVSSANNAMCMGESGSMPGENQSSEEMNSEQMEESGSDSEFLSQDKSISCNRDSKDSFPHVTNGYIPAPAVATDDVAQVIPHSNSVVEFV